MEAVKEYTYALICILAVCGIAINISPEGEMKKYIRYICLLCTAAAVCIPAIKAIGGISEDISDFPQFTTDENAAESDKINDVFIASAKSNTEAALCAYICEKYGYESGSVTVKAILDTSDISKIEIKKLQIVLPSGKNAAKIKAELYEMFLYKTEIELEWG